MRTGRFSVVVLLCVFVMMMTGCVSQEQYEDMKAQNRIQQSRIASLESQLSDAQLQLEQLQKQLAALRGRSGTDIGAKDAEIAALEKDIEAKKALIAKMQAQLLRSGAPLPMELNVMLQEFAGASDMVTFDVETGMLKFKSDLLFDLGSDNVKSTAAAAIKSLCGIMNSEQGKQFDLLIAGHTDDVPIKKPATKAKHPTNWHLSAHRSIAVLNIMTGNGIAPERLSVRGFGEYRPIDANKANKGGNAANRRVEVFIVPSGT
jgi:chemotaxis protein MotB